MVDESITAVVRTYLKRLESAGFGKCYAVVYGSRAEGKSDRWSDIDLLVVSPVFDESISREHVNTLWRIAAVIDSRIEPIPVGAEQYESDDSSAIIEIARRKGHIISPAA